jgi:hypothetical protein
MNKLASLAILSLLRSQMCASLFVRAGSRPVIEDYAGVGAGYVDELNVTFFPAAVGPGQKPNLGTLSAAKAAMVFGRPPESPPKNDLEHPK